MINRIRQIFHNSLLYVSLWENKEELSKTELEKINELTNEITEFRNSEFFPIPSTEFQAFTQLKLWDNIYNENKDLLNTTPKNINVLILLDLLNSLNFQIMGNYHCMLRAMTDKARKRYFEEFDPHFKQIDTQSTKYQELYKVLGRKELTEELCNINYSRELKNWCNTHSRELYTKVNVSLLYNTIKSLNFIEVDFTRNTLENWIKYER